MRLFLSGLIAGVLVVGAWLMLAAYLGSIEYEGSEREPRERVARDTSTRTIEDEREERDTPPRPIVEEREEYDIESLVLDCPIGWHPPDNLPNGAKLKDAHPRLREYPVRPNGAQEDGRSHIVQFVYDIERGGNTSNVRIVGAAPSDLWNRSVVTAVSSWTYWPATLDGEPIKLNYCIDSLVLE